MRLSFFTQMKGPARFAAFRRVWLVGLVAYSAIWMANVTAAWVMTRLEPSPLMVALVQSATTLPFFLLALPAGVWSDRVDRRRLMRGLHAVNLLVSLLLGGLLLSGQMTPLLLLFLTFVLGGLFALNAPASQAIIADTVPREELLRAVTLNSISFNLARSLGPALAGLLLVLANPGVVFLINAVGYALALVSTQGARVPAGFPGGEAGNLRGCLSQWSEVHSL